MIPQIMGLPAGAEVILLFLNKKDPRSNVVMCRWDEQFVTWYFNLEEGGCHLGIYGDYDHCLESFFLRVKSQRMGD